MIEQEEIVQQSDHEEESVKIRRDRKAEKRIFVFAPLYLQSDNIWVLDISTIIAIALWVKSVFSIIKAFPIIKEFSILFYGLFLTASLYIMSYLGDNKLGVFLFRLGSFAFLVPSVILLVTYIPMFLEMSLETKEKIKATFTTKNVIAAILGILAFGTALFQFLQVLLQIFYR